MEDLTRELLNIPTLRFKSDEVMREQLLSNIAQLQTAINEISYEFQFETSPV